MRIEGQAGAKPQTTQKAAGAGNQPTDEQIKEYPRAQTLQQVLRDPELRKKLEEKIGEDLVGKLDKIFNAQPAGMPPVPVEAQQAYQMKQMQQAQQEQAEKQAQPQKAGAQDAKV